MSVHGFFIIRRKALISKALSDQISPRFPIFRDLGFLIRICVSSYWQKLHPESEIMIVGFQSKYLCTPTREQLKNNLKSFYRPKRYKEALVFWLGLLDILYTYLCIKPCSKQYAESQGDKVVLVLVIDFVSL